MTALNGSKTGTTLDQINSETNNYQSDFLACKKLTFILIYS